MNWNTKDILIALTTTTSLVAAGTVVAFGAVAQGDKLGNTEESIRAALVEKGAQIEEIEREGDIFEVEFTFEGKEYEAEIDAATSLVASLDDDDDDDDGEDSDDDSDDGEDGEDGDDGEDSDGDEGDDGDD